MHRLTLVMDKGFFSKNNVKNLLSGPLKGKILLSLPWAVPFAQEQVAREREGIDNPDRVIVFGKEVIRGVSRRLDWPGMKGDNPVPVYVHIYYNLTNLNIKNNLDLNRLRVHSDTTMSAKVFIDFISLIILSHIHKVMLENELYKSMTKLELIRSMEKLRVQDIKGKRILFPGRKVV